MRTCVSVCAGFAVAVFVSRAWGGAADPAHLELRLVPKYQSASSEQPPILSLADATRQYELQYRLTDLDPADGIEVQALVGAAVAIDAIRNGVTGEFAPSSVVFGGSETGLHRPFRDAITSNSSMYNGVAGPDGLSTIVGLNLRQFMMSMATWTPLYSFDFTATGGQGVVEISASFVRLPGQEGAFAFYTEGSPVPIASDHGTGGSTTLVVSIPAPSGAGVVLLAAAGAVLRRRRSSFGACADAWGGRGRPCM